MTNQQEMMKTLPKTEFSSSFVFNAISPDDAEVYWSKPYIGICDYDGQSVLELSTESGNINSFVYHNDRVVDIKDELKEWAKKYNKQWECRYEGTYVLLDQ